jgi:hypothetical protein
MKTLKKNNNTFAYKDLGVLRSVAAYVNCSTAVGLDVEIILIAEVRPYALKRRGRENKHFVKFLVLN